MTRTQKVAWDEGMLLTPHHFQQWDRHHASLLDQRVRGIQSAEWGLTALEVDAEALAGSELALRACAGVTRGCLCFSAPDRDPLPPPRSFKDLFDPTQGSLGAYLGVPIPRRDQVELADPSPRGEAPQTPYVRASIGVADEVRGGSQRDVGTMAVNLRVLFDGEPLEEFQTIKIASIVRTPAGSHALAEDFIPTCLHASVAPFIPRMMRRVIETLSSRAEELAGQQRRSGGMAEAAAFWLRHTLNGRLPELVHLFHKERVHPELPFLSMACLAAELSTFAGPGNHPRDLPVYDHGDLGAAFGALDEKLSALLETVVPTRCVPIALSRSGDSLFTAALNDEVLLRQGRFYLAVGADVPEDRLLVEIPAKAKISSRDRVQELITMALRGLALKHVPSPPTEIPVQPGRTYFSLEKSGEHWEAVAATRSFAMHLPSDYPDLRLELMAIRE